MNVETFKAIRLYLEKNQQEFAEFLGVANSTVAGIEAGNRPISDQVRARVARKFSVDAEFLEFMERNKKLSM
ncbi:transcriptional regulator with XRE-family HTH domain [Lederbergia galactosidilyticus]|uniref:helix-turn-helix domain-containing protein n=1 Tax=Lederbergia galactosidilytica TaxID=217031 RepID=UPI001AE4EA71|nr:helix-turn-helix transcriptional regulator [Lederbergia galactosidilytica]MBP1913253.1 transcriptional regulator with XRE-family HTH domain [Lederbergia galactosidilytica]